MSDNSANNNKRIAKNTLALYFRMLFTLVIGLYTSRVVLHALGFSDFGLYNVVGGFVAMFGFLNHTLAAGTQRFLSISIGKNDETKLHDVFSSSLFMHVCLAGIIFLVAQSVGLWFLYNQMNIEPDRLMPAAWVFEFSIVASIIQIIQVPFMSALIAHERMGIYAYISIVEVVLKLLIVYLILLSDFDRLILYAFLVMVVHFFTALIYNVYCRRNYSECTFSLNHTSKTLKELSSFSGWVIVGMGASTLQGQGVNVLLNILFGSVINAARGLAFQVNNVILHFANNFLTAVNPQIFKLYANGEREKVFRLVTVSALMAAYLLLILMMPLFVDIEYILHLWLGEYPEYTGAFIRIVFIQSIMAATIRPVIILTHAVGKMKMPNIIGGGCVLLAIPFAFIAYNLRTSPIIVFAASMIPWIFEEFFDLYFAWKYARFPMLSFYKQTYLRIFLIGISMYFIIYYIYQYLHFPKMVNFLIMSMICFILTLSIIYIVGIDRKMRESICRAVSNICHNYAMKFSN